MTRPAPLAKHPAKHLAIRLLAETSLIVGLVVLGVLALLPWIGAPAGLAAPWAALLVVMLAAPWIYWRTMHAVRTARHAEAGAPAEGKGQAPADSITRLQRRRQRAIVMTAVAHLAGLGLTTAALAYVHTQLHDEAHLRFERLVERLEAEVQRRFNQPLQGLKGARAAFAISRSINRDQFRGYVEARDIDGEFPGVRGFGFVERIPPAEAAAYARERIAEGLPDYRVRSAGQPAEHYVVKYVEPLSPNITALGFDMGSEPVRRAAVEQAIDTGEPTLTGHLMLGLGERRAPGFLLLLPLYRPGSDPSTPEQRRRALVGLVYAPMFAADLLRNATAAVEGGLDFELFHGDGTELSRLVFDADEHLQGQTGLVNSARHYGGRLFETPRTLTIGGRLLTLRASSTPAFEATVDRRPLLLIGGGGALLSLLMAMAVWALASARVRAQTLAERMTADLALQHRRLDSILNGTNAGSWEWNPQTHATIANERWAGLLGLTLAEVGPITPARWAELVHPEDLPRVQHALGRHLGGETEAYEAEFRMRHQAGHWVWILARGRIASRSADGRPEWVAGTHLDISHVKQAEAQLRSANEELTLARDKAEQASLTKSRFLANMSHEIRTPMNAILGMLQLLRRTALSRQQHDYAEKTERAARALLGLLNDILDFSKVEAGKLALDPKPFVLDGLLRDLSVVLSANLGHKPVEVLFDVDPAVPAALVGDDMRLQQVLVNLAGNALKFTERGEVVVSLRRLDAGTDAQAEIEFSVRDTGIGIAPEQQQHIFTGFSQAEASTTRRFGGTGLGLSICQRLVTLMGGEIRLESEPGRGSRFSFVLRLAVVPNDAASAAPLPPLHALVVDDNPVARGVLATLAGSLGWRVDLAASGEEALALLEQASAEGRGHDAVFVDWQMPGLDGWQTSERIRQRHDAGERMPLVMMVTAHGRERLAERSAAEQRLLDAFLVKPVTASMLAEAVHIARSGEGLQPAARPATGARLQGLRLLLVEDNANNRQVACELLEAEGATVETAHDGAAGVAAVAAAAGRLDAVLMDVQMPVMDGLSATSEIRQRLGLHDLPVIAMTANAMASDRDASRAAGMNDHVGKPFDLDELVAVLLKHLRPLPVVTAPVLTAPEAAAVPATAALPAALLEQAAAQGIALAAAVSRLGHKPAVWARAAQACARELPQRWAEVEQALRQDEAHRAASLLHAIKGEAATVGAQPLAELAGSAERTAREQGLAAVRAGQAALAAAAAQAAAALADLARALLPVAATSLAPAERDGPALRAALQALLPWLEASDMEAVQAFAQLEQHHLAAWPEALAPLAQALACFDFDTAHQACRQLLESLDTEPEHD